MLVDSNYVYSTNLAFYRSGRPATGILIGAESSTVSPFSHKNQIYCFLLELNLFQSSVTIPTINVTIQNNLVVHTGGISSYHEGSVCSLPTINYQSFLTLLSFSLPLSLPHLQNYVTGVKLYFNTVWGISGINSFYWQTQPNTGNNVMRNNIFWAQVCETSYLYSILLSYLFSLSLCVCVCACLLFPFISPCLQGLFYFLFKIRTTGAATFVRIYPKPSQFSKYFN